MAAVREQGYVRPLHSPLPPLDEEDDAETVDLVDAAGWPSLVL